MLPSAPYFHTPSIYALPAVKETKFDTHTRQQAKLEFSVFYSSCFEIANWKENFLDRKVACILQIQFPVNFYMDAIELSPTDKMASILTQ
jgi:hypothetical protein